MGSIPKIILALSHLFVLNLAINMSNDTNTNITLTCGDEKLYDTLDVNEVFGKWKVIDVYLHISNESAREFNTCPVVTIWQDEFYTSTFGPSSVTPLFHVQHLKAKFRQEYRHLRLLWDEAGQTIEYALFFRNDSAGYWQVSEAQNGTIPARAAYNQFSGSIQVLKAVNDHLVLNFCQEPTQGRSAQLYSVLLSREPGQMARWEREAVHNMLQNKKLSTASRRMVCGNSAGKPLTSLLVSFVTCILAVVVSST